MESKKPIVLVVEGNETTAKLIQRYLEKADYSVTVAESGLKAIEVLNKLKPNDLPHCITMAIMIQPMDGFEACRHIKKDKQLMDIPIIMVSSQNDVQRQIESVRHGADGFISKPIESILLLHEVGKAAKATRQAREIIRLNKELAEHNSVHSILKTQRGRDNDVGVDDALY